MPPDGSSSRSPIVSGPGGGSDAGNQVQITSMSREYPVTEELADTSTRCSTVADAEAGAPKTAASTNAKPARRPSFRADIYGSWKESASHGGFHDGATHNVRQTLSNGGSGPHIPKSWLNG